MEFKVIHEKINTLLLKGKPVKLPDCLSAGRMLSKNRLNEVPCGQCILKNKGFYDKPKKITIKLFEHLIYTHLLCALYEDMMITQIKTTAYIWQQVY